MKLLFFLVNISVILFSCNNSSGPATDPLVPVQKDTARNFFPVTSYIKGEIYNIKTKGINPIKYVTIDQHTDSSWLKIEDLDGFVKEFLSPHIDSMNLVSLFGETSFL